MGKYNSAIITTEGINMFTSAIGGGETVTFMTMQASSHAYPSTTDFMSLTSLQDVEATVNVNYAGVYNTNVVQVSARFDNDGVSTAYLINTLGLFAKLGSGDPKLVAVVTAVTPDQMPVYDANNPSAFIYNLQCTVQNAGSMAVSVNPAGTVTVEQFNEEMATKLGRTDNAVSATKLVTSRSLTVDLGSTTPASFDGSADANIGVSGELPIANGGTGASTQAGARSALGVPPTNHAVANTTYGSGTATNYGHVKLSDTYDTVDANADAVHGVGASQNALANAYRNLQPQIDSLEPRVSSSEQALTVNLLNPALASVTAKGITITRNADNTYTLNGTATDNVYFDLIITPFRTAKACNLKILGCPQGGSVQSYFIIVTPVNARDFGDGAEVSLEPNTDYGVKVGVKSGTVCDNLLFKPMLTTNLSATYDDYVPYSGSSGKLDTDYKTLHDAIDTKAPTNHAAANTTYGSGTATNYGHVKLSDDYDTVDANAKAANGVGASAWAMQAGLDDRVKSVPVKSFDEKITNIVFNNDIDYFYAYVGGTARPIYPLPTASQTPWVTPSSGILSVISTNMITIGKLRIANLVFNVTSSHTFSDSEQLFEYNQSELPAGSFYVVGSSNGSHQIGALALNGDRTIRAWGQITATANSWWCFTFVFTVL